MVILWVILNLNDAERELPGERKGRRDNREKWAGWEKRQEGVIRGKHYLELNGYSTRGKIRK